MSSSSKSSAKMCPVCRGIGKTQDGKCATCDGTGEITPRKKKPAKHK